MNLITTHYLSHLQKDGNASQRISRHKSVEEAEMRIKILNFKQRKKKTKNIEHVKWSRHAWQRKQTPHGLTPRPSHLRILVNPWFATQSASKIQCSPCPPFQLLLMSKPHQIPASSHLLGWHWCFHKGHILHSWWSHEPLKQGWCICPIVSGSCHDMQQTASKAFRGGWRNDISINKVANSRWGCKILRWNLAQMEFWLLFTIKLCVYKLSHLFPDYSSSTIFSSINYHQSSIPFCVMGMITSCCWGTSGRNGSL